MIYVLTRTITNPQMREPVIQSTELDAPDFKAALDRIAVSNEHRCKLRNEQRTTWTDSRNSTIELTLQPKDMHE